MKSIKLLKKKKKQKTTTWRAKWRGRTKYRRQLLVTSVSRTRIKAAIYDELNLNFYGTNLWTFRIKMIVPSAEFVSIARLDNYRLDFIKYSKFWGGPTATMVPTANAHIWGVIWRLHIDDIAVLDSYKGVEVKKYYIRHVEVLTPYLGTLLCRAYKQKVIPLPRADNDVVPVERWPSKSYKKVLLLGAAEHHLPEYYVRDLIKLKHNGEEGCFRMTCLLRRYARDVPCECRVPGRIPRKPLKLDLKRMREEKKQK